MRAVSPPSRRPLLGMVRMAVLLASASEAAARHQGPVTLTSGACGATVGFIAGPPPTLWERFAKLLGMGKDKYDAVQCTEVTGSSRIHALSEPQSGRQQRTKLLFAGCARNAAGSIPAMSGHIDELGRMHADYRVLVWEDGSTDHTRTALAHWAASNPRVRLLFGDSPTWKGLNVLPRPARIAFCRNVLLSEAVRAPLARDSGAFNAGVLVQLDLDCPPRMEPLALVEALQHMAFMWPPRVSEDRSRRRWHVLTGNSLPSYYDLWALRSSKLGIDYDCLRNQTAIARSGICFSYDIRLEPAAPLLPVDSAFNGVGAYSLEAVRASGCRYETNSFLRTCEHVGFHACLRRHGLKIGIAPMLVQGCGGEHEHSEHSKTRHVLWNANGTVSNLDSLA